MPKDLKLDGNEEVFTVAVTYDTRELYGVVTATREFTIFKGE